MLIAIEGIDGSGKATQATMLQCAFRRLLSKSVGLISYPRYGTGLFSQKIADYLNGKYGEINSIPADFLSILFAADRFESKSYLTDLLESSDVVVADRYVASNIAHQGAKLPEEDFDEFCAWIQKLEYEIFDLPKPELTIYLDIDPKIAWKSISLKSNRTYTKETRDIHEADIEHLYAARYVYRKISKQCDRSWFSVSCNRSNSMKSSNEIHREIFEFCKDKLV